MSCNYADGLSPYHDKGQLGLDERFDNKSVINIKVEMLAKWINKAKHVVIHTGAGISTSAGIPDFRGPKGVWTLEAKGEKPDMSTDFNDAVPTPTHMAITRLVSSGKAKYVVSQNIDGLHLRSGLSRRYLSELHGNMFVEQCNTCNRQFVRNSAVPTVGQKCLNKACPTIKPNGRACRGRLHDTILDWEHNLPENDLAMGDFNSCLADLSIALGTTMQIVPSGTLPLYTKKAGGKLVIINLQPTKHDAKADLLIHGYVDEVMALLMKQLSLKVPKYSPKNDPTKLALSSDKYFEWTISDKTTQEMRKIYEAKCGSKEARKRLDMIDEDDIPLIERKRKATDDKPIAVKTKKREADDSDIEILESPRKSRTRGRKGKEESSPPLPPAPVKFTIKKNVTPTKTKYEIVKPSVEAKIKKKTCEIVKFEDDDAMPDLEMICESDDEGTNLFTTNFRRYLYEDNAFKKEEKPDIVELIEDDAPVGTSTEKLPDHPDIKDEEKKEETPMEAGGSEKNESKEKEVVEVGKVKVAGSVVKLENVTKSVEKIAESVVEADKSAQSGAEVENIADSVAEVDKVAKSVVAANNEAGSVVEIEKGTELSLAVNGTLEKATFEGNAITASDGKSSAPVAREQSNEAFVEKSVEDTSVSIVCDSSIDQQPISIGT